MRIRSISLRLSENKSKDKNCHLPEKGEIKMRDIQIKEINISEEAIAWALDLAKKGDRESLRWLQDRRLEGNEAASRALVELAFCELGLSYTASLR